MKAVVLCAVALCGIVVCSSDTGWATPVASDIERAFLKVPSAPSAREHLRYITSRPHVAGTDGDFVMAEYVRRNMESYGLDSWIENLTVFLNYPEEAPQLTYISNGLDAPTKVINLVELPLPQDHTSDTLWRNHTFHGYGASGDAIGRLVYANFGRPADFDELHRLGVDVKGAVVLVRYGECFRGLKVRNAELRGAIAVIMYSDPQQDGYQLGSVYPNGSWRPDFGVQRGSVQFNSLCSGDPARVDGPRTVEELCGYKSEDLIPSIPSIPLSYGSALELLKVLGGVAGPAGFQGGLPLNYSVGPSSSFKMRLQTKLRSVRAPIPNVITRIEGLINDRPIILGNHRDAWVYGAADPNSGTASMLELARGLGALKKQGWRPLRTIILCSWSGEEYGLLGSTGWAEHNEVLVSNAVAYINVDVAVSGNLLKGGGTFALRDNFLGALRAVRAPDGGSLTQATDWVPIGSGSDYAVFLDHFGVASIDFSFERAGRGGKSAPYGQYHSVYDSFDWMNNFGAGGEFGGIPGQAFEYMSALAGLWGVVALRMADASILPFNHSAQAEALELWRQHLVEEVPQLSTAGLADAVQAYSRAATYVDREIRVALASGGHGEKHTDELNDRLAFTERRFLSEGGLPKRKWFRSVLQAPGIDEGYAPQTFPGVHDELVSGYDPAALAEAQKQLNVVAACVAAAAAYLKGGAETGVEILV